MGEVSLNTFPYPIVRVSAATPIRPRRIRRYGNQASSIHPFHQSIHTSTQSSIQSSTQSAIQSSIHPTIRPSISATIHLFHFHSFIHYNTNLFFCHLSLFDFFLDMMKCVSQMPIILLPLHFDRDPILRLPSCQRSIVIRTFITNDFMTGIPATPGKQIPEEVRPFNTRKHNLIKKLFTLGFTLVKGINQHQLFDLFE